MSSIITLGLEAWVYLGGAGRGFTLFSPEPPLLTGYLTSSVAGGMATSSHTLTWQSHIYSEHTHFLVVKPQTAPSNYFYRLCFYELGELWLTFFLTHTPQILACSVTNITNWSQSVQFDLFLKQGHTWLSKLSISGKLRVGPECQDAHTKAGEATIFLYIVS